MSSWQEYLNAQGKLVEKPEVDASADTGPESPKCPPAAVTKGKGWDAKSGSKSEKPAPYTPANGNAKPAKGEKGGFADKGDSKLVYEPETPEKIDPEGGKKVKTWPKVGKAEEFVLAVKDMPLADLTAYVAECATVREVIPSVSADPIQAMRYTAFLSAANDSLMETLVREFKRNGGFNQLLETLLEQPETYKGLAAFVAEDEGRLRRLTAALHEITEAPASETEVTKKDTKLKVVKPRTPKTVDGAAVDVAGAGVQASR